MGQTLLVKGIKHRNKKEENSSQTVATTLLYCNVQGQSRHFIQTKICYFCGTLFVVRSLYLVFFITPLLYTLQCTKRGKIVKFLNCKEILCQEDSSKKFEKPNIRNIRTNIIQAGLSRATLEFFSNFPLRTRKIRSLVAEIFNF